MKSRNMESCKREELSESLKFWCWYSTQAQRNKLCFCTFDKTIEKGTCNNVKLGSSLTLCVNDKFSDNYKTSIEKQISMIANTAKQQNRSPSTIELSKLEAKMSDVDKGLKVKNKNERIAEISKLICELESERLLLTLELNTK
jgi:hypothetical protein